MQRATANLVVPMESPTPVPYVQINAEGSADRFHLTPSLSSNMTSSTWISTHSPPRPIIHPQPSTYQHQRIPSNNMVTPSSSSSNSSSNQRPYSSPPLPFHSHTPSTTVTPAMSNYESSIKTAVLPTSTSIAAPSYARITNPYHTSSHQSTRSTTAPNLTSATPSSSSSSVLSAKAPTLSVPSNNATTLGQVAFTTNPPSSASISISTPTNEPNHIGTASSNAKDTIKSNSQVAHEEENTESNLIDNPKNLPRGQLLHTVQLTSEELAAIVQSREIIFQSTSPAASLTPEKVASYHYSSSASPTPIRDKALMDSNEMNNSNNNNYNNTTDNNNGQQIEKTTAESQRTQKKKQNKVTKKGEVAFSEIKHLVPSSHPEQVNWHKSLRSGK